MLDNGQYSGSLLFIGMDEKILDSESETKMFEEMASIVQNPYERYHRYDGGCTKT